MARKKHPGQRNSLDALCQRYFISNEHRTLHGALLDSEILAEVYLSMTGGQLSMLGEQQDGSKESLQEAAANLTFSADRTLTKIIPASEEELAGHDQWMALLSKNRPEKISW